MKIKHKRIFALLIDFLIIGTITSLSSNFFEVESELGTTSIFGRSVIYGISWCFLFYLMYFITFDIFNNAITVGKQLLKINVILKNNKSLSFQTQIYRTILKTVSILLLPISALVFIINGNALEDSFCQTKTVENSYIVST